jgi:gamma-glutamyltranspeptidase/glutathione hydrolase
MLTIQNRLLARSIRAFLLGSALVAGADASARAPRRHAPAHAAAIAPGEAMVSAADPRAAAAGVEILKAGGSATDAAIATMLALNVVEPQNSGLGGGAFYIRADSATGALASIDGREAAPRAAGPNWFLGTDGKPIREGYIGGRSAGVPGSLALMAQAHRKFGKLPWARLFTPAIRLAQDGIVVSPRLHNGLDKYGRHIEGAARAIFLDAQGNPVAIGATLRQPELAHTMQMIARLGTAPFYRGAPAAAMVSTLNHATRNPSQMTIADFASYRAIDRTPICGTFRGWKVCGMGPPSSGGVTVLMILKQLERFDMAALGRANPVAWHLIAESERLAYADRDAYLADPAFVTVPVSGLLDPTYIAGRSALISPSTTLATIVPGAPTGTPPRKSADFKPDPGTSSLSVADSHGEVVTVTASINGYFGSGLASGGVTLNNELPDFDFMPTKKGVPTVNRVEGGKRPRSSMSPTIVYGPDGKVRLAIGAAGGPTIICQVAKALIGMIDWKLSAQDAIAMGLVFAPTRGGALEKGTELEAMLPDLQKLGETLQIAPLGLKANAVERVGGRWVGAADPRSEGVAVDTAGTVTTIVRRSNDLNGAHE